MLLDEAHGKYIARMDTDDIMLSEWLQVQFDYMEYHSSIDLVASEMYYIRNIYDDVELYNLVTINLHHFENSKMKF